MKRTADRAQSQSRYSFQAPPWLQEAWIRRLLWYFSLYNENYLDRRLDRPLFRIGLAQQQLGEWCPRTRCITMSEWHILENPWESVLETLRHEMAHQYVDEVLELHGVEPHGEAFRRACRLLRCNPAPTGVRGSMEKLEESSAERDRILVRVKDLLALASSPNEHEAANAMRMANKYLLRYNLDLAEATKRRQSSEAGFDEYETRYLGTCSARIQEYEYTLGTILQDHFFVHVIWTFSYDSRRNRPGRVLEICGLPANLDIAEYVHGYVASLTGPLWSQYRGSHPQKRGRCTKLQYLAGLLRGFQDKLDRQKKQLKEEHGLIWLGDVKLDEYYRWVNPRVRSVSMSGVRRNRGFTDGYADGKKITVHRGVKSSSVNRGRLLPRRD